jgi:AraC-like DNA-binding protein
LDALSVTRRAVSQDQLNSLLIHKERSLPEHLPGIRQSSPRVSVDLVSGGPPLIDEFAIKLPHVSFMLAFGEHSSWEAIGPRPLVKRHFRNRFHFIPAETELKVRLAGADETIPEFVAMLIDAAFADMIMAELFDRGDRGKPTIGNAEAKLLALAKTIRGQMLERTNLKALQLESFATLCLAEWSDHANGSSPTLIAPKALGRVKDYMHTHLDRDLTLADLASIAELSPSHFLKSFKETTGQTPHRYLTARRIEKARGDLETTNLPLAEIAYGAGFASQSHMTDVFRKHLHISPGRYRKSMRS